MTAHTQTQSLKHRILIFTILGIVFTAFVVGISVGLPFYTFVKAGNDKALIMLAKNRAILVETYLTGLRSVASQVTTRTFVRIQLEKYLQGDMGMQELEYLTSPVLNDAMRMLPELVAIVRHDNNGQALVHVGVTLHDVVWDLSASSIIMPQVKGPIKVADKYYMYVTAAIYNRKKKQLGTDVLVFELSELRNIIRDTSGLGLSGEVQLGWRENEGIKLFFNQQFRDNENTSANQNSPLAIAVRNAINGDEGILDGNQKLDDDYMTAFSPIPNSDWGVAASMSSAELYMSVKHQILFTSGMIIFLTIIGTIATFILIRPLSGKMLLHSDELEHEIDEKIIEIKRVNKSLNALNTVNEILLRTSSESELLDEICRVIVDVAGFNLAWIGMVNGKDVQHVHEVKQYGCGVTCMDMELLMQDEKAWLKSPGSIAMKTGKPAVFKDMAASDCFSGYWVKTCDYDCVSVVGFPLIVGEKILGVLLVYASIANAFEDEQISLMMKMADNLAYGLVALRDKSDRQKLQRQLLQSQKMESIGQLTGGIAHDFNNMLASILGYTDLLQDIYRKEKNNSKEQIYLSRIEKSGERARDLVSQMLAFSRGGSSEPVPVLLEEKINESLKMLLATIPSSIELKVDVVDGELMVLIDPVQFHQLLMNLCINARDAMNGAGKIDIVAQKVVLDDEECASCFSGLDGEYVELLVRDTGAGMENQLQERIFDPFFTTKDVGKGTGMGLSMVHGIMHEHKGHILVDSILGEGTSFHLLFPVLNQTELSCDIEKETEVVAQHAETKHILVIDDNVDVAEFEQEILLNHGYRVTMKTSSVEALDLFKQDPHEFDLVLTDQTMPGMTGVEIVREILAISPQMPVIMCSGYSEQVDELGAEKLGVYKFLNKPIDIKKLIAAINEISQ